MEAVAPWAALCAEIEPHYPRGGGRGRPPIGLERMLRMYLAQKRAPDATTLLKFRRLLETHQLSTQRRINPAPLPAREKKHMKSTLTAGLLLLAVSAVPTMAVESPYLPLAQAGGGALALKEDPAKDPVLLELLGRFNRKTVLEKLPMLNIGQRERIMGYYKLARSQPGISDRTVANGVSGMVLGYVETDDVRRFVDEYAKTGKLPKGLPLPYANFKGASEKFPGAETFLAHELSSTKKLDEQISSILDVIIADAEKRSADAKRQRADIAKQIEFLESLLKAVN